MTRINNTLSRTMSIVKSMSGSSSFALHSRQLQKRLIAAIRSASTTTQQPPPPKPRLLEKPERFNPPSHGQRLKTKKPASYGAPLSPQARAAQARKQYPHMMPPEGSFMFWFLTNRSVHVVISLGILLFLVVGTWFQNFVHTTPYKELLPPNSMFFAHPIQWLQQYASLYGLHTQWNTEKTMERRKQQNDDVARRSEYRKAHGLDSGEKAGWFGGWTARSDEEMLGPGLRTGYTATVNAEPPIELTPEIPQRKKWLGIW